MQTIKITEQGEKQSEVKHTQKETFSILLEEELYEKIKSTAEAEQLTISDWLVDAALKKLSKAS